MVAISLTLGFAVLLAWLLRPRRHSAHEKNWLPFNGNVEDILPKHYRYFPQIRQALSAGDNQYLREVAPPRVAQQVLRERRAVARRFLRGLREDFSNLHRLARMIAAISPVVSRQQEMERLLLNLKFQMLYVFVWLRISTGAAPLAQIERLTELIGGLALRMEHAMAEISALSTDRLARGVNA